MLPLSEADLEVKAAVERITGACRCEAEYLRELNVVSTRGVGPEYDPECIYHALGEAIADLIRDNRRLRNALGRLNIHRQLRKD